MTREELIARQERLQKLHKKAEALLLPLPGVVGVGIGLKETNNQTTDDISFRVYVEKKKTPGEVPPDQMVPDEVLGVRTDVIEVSEREQQVDQSEYRPVKGGIQTGNGTGGVGTLGCVAQRTSDNAFVILSNHHVMFAGGKGVGDKMGQPDFSESCCCSCGEIGTIAAGAAGGLIDCAIAVIKSGISHVQQVNQIGNIAGTAAAVVGEAVSKVGRTTGLTTGRVLDINVTTSSAGNNFTNQIDIEPTGTFTRFSAPGDSGSVILNSLNQVISLHWGGDGRVGTSCHIANVMSAMGITIPVSGGESAVADLPPVGAAEPAPLPTERELLLRRTERTLRRTAQGRAVLNVVLEFRFEVMRLIQNQRAVGATWQRRQGPAFLAALFRSLKEPTYRIPQSIEGVTARSLLMGMAAALEEHGSPGLQAAIGRHALAVLAAAEQHHTVTEILTQLTGKGRPVAVA